MITGSIAGVSPRFSARLAGLFYLLYVVIAGLAGFARRRILIGGDASATATNLQWIPLLVIILAGLTEVRGETLHHRIDATQGN